MSKLEGIKHDPRNARKHTPRNLSTIEQSIQRDGFGRSVLLANDGTVIAGNATIDAAASAGFDDVLVVETDGTKVIAVKRTDVEPGSEQFTRLALADNRAAELASWDAEVLAGLNEEMDLSAFFADDELARVLAEEPAFNPYSEWVGMPEFQQNDEMPAKQLIVSFRSEADVEAFARLINQNVKMTTKSIWYPMAENAVYADKAFVTEDDDE